jgi:hypothetical protein
VALLVVPPLGGKPRDTGPVDVLGAVVDEQDGLGRGPDVLSGFSEEGWFGLCNAEFTGVATDVEEVVISEGGPHVPGAVLLLVGTEVDAEAATAKCVDDLEGL